MAKIPKREVVLILWNIRSLHNVGSIFRTADGVGARKIYLLGITPVPVDRLNRPRAAFAKVSLGAESSVAWERASSFGRLIAQLRREQYSVCALEQSRSSLSYVNLPKKIKKIALVLGEEVKGLPPRILQQTDYVLEIPMFGKKESLNVGVAAGVALFRLIIP